MPSSDPLAPAAILSISPGSAQDGAAGGVFRVRVIAQWPDGTPANGAHVLFAPLPGSVALTVLDGDVTVSASTPAVARVLVEPGQNGDAILEARVAGADSAQLRIQVPVRPLQLSASSPFGPWLGSLGSVLDIHDAMALSVDLIVDPSSGLRGFDSDTQAQPRIKIEAQDAVVSPGCLDIPALGPAPNVVIVSTRPHFEGQAVAQRSSLVRLSCPDDPTIPPLQISVTFPDGVAKATRALEYLAATNSFRTEDVLLALEPVSGNLKQSFTTSGVSPSAVTTPPPAVSPGPVPVLSVGPVAVHANPLTSGPVVGVFSPQMLPQTALPGKSLPIPYQVRLVDITGAEYRDSTNSQDIHQPGGPLKINWRSNSGMLDTVPNSTGTPYLSVGIDTPVYLTPVGSGPWELEATLTGNVYDEHAPVLSGVGPSGAWQYRSSLNLSSRSLTYRFVVQDATGRSSSACASGADPFL